MDPTGFSFWKKFFGIVGLVVAAIVAPPLAVALELSVLGTSALGVGLAAAGAAAGQQVGQGLDAAVAKTDAQQPQMTNMPVDSLPAMMPASIGGAMPGMPGLLGGSPGMGMVPRSHGLHRLGESAERAFDTADAIYDALLLARGGTRLARGAAHAFMRGVGESGADIAGSLDIGRAAAGPGKTVVIGESMDRVKDVARQIGAKWYQAWKMNPYDETRQLKRNERWIRSKIRQGYRIIDIGLNKRRSTRSEAYGLERRILEELNYPVEHR